MDTDTKSAWIDEKKRIISFTAVPGSTVYTAAVPRFWEHILDLMRRDYRIG